MDKQWFKSKTVWGALLFAISSFLTQSELLPANLVTELVQWFGVSLGVYGIRDAMD